MDKPIFIVQRYAGPYLFYADRYVRPADLMANMGDKWRTVFYRIEDGKLFTTYNLLEGPWHIRDGDFAATVINAWKTWVIQSAILDDSDSM